MRKSNEHLASSLFWLLLSSLYTEQASRLHQNGLSDVLLTAFHICMSEAGFRFEALPDDPVLIRSFIFCCAKFSTEGSDNFTFKGTDIGPDGRDIISMSPREIQYIFGIDSNLSNSVHLFISHQLTAHLQDTGKRYVTPRPNCDERLT